MRRVALAILAAIAWLIIPVSAAASPPTILKYSFEAPPLTASGVCGFDFTITPTISATEIDYFDSSGTLTGFYIHATEQDIIVGPGTTLVSTPYTYNVEARFDSSGDTISVVISGVVLKVRLPDGSLFLSAGRINVLAHPGAQFALVPDFGRSGNLNALCAALA